jgi:hypothetical protein
MRPDQPPRLARHDPYGVIFFLLEKLGAVVGVSNLHIYAAMRGQSLEDFQKTRNAPGALYSVVGRHRTRLRIGTRPGPGERVLPADVNGIAPSLGAARFYGRCHSKKISTPSNTELS